MPARPSHLPTHIERSALQALLGGRELTAAGLTRGRATIKTMLGKGWIEHGSSHRVYRITPTGVAALRAPLPDRVRTGSLKAKGK